jgi:protein phosphatase
VLAQAVQTANTTIYNFVKGSPLISQAASTVTIALVKDGQVHVANVGDSRTYLIRGGAATQLTRDHTLTQQKIELGRLQPAQADLDEDRGIITRSLGSESTVQVDVFPPLPLEAGDALLLCSDGLTDMLSNADIARLAGGKHPKAAVGRLIAEANRRGGHDNISVVMGRVGGQSSGAGWSLPLALLLGGVVLLVAAILLLVGGLSLGRLSTTAGAPATPTDVGDVAQVIMTPLPPTPTALAVATLAALPSASATAAPTGSAVLGVLTTSTPLPTYTPAPIPTLAGPPPVPSPEGDVSTPLPGEPTRAPVPPAVSGLAAPVLQDPLDGASAFRGHGPTFKWRWDGELAEGWGFEVRIWREGDDHYGAFDVRELMKYVARQPDGSYAVGLLVEGAYGVHLHGEGEYFWTVAVVQVDPYVRIGPEAAPRKLKYEIPAPDRGEPSSGKKDEEPEPPPP